MFEDILPILHGGFLPGDRNDQPRVGFMENNKWGYDEVLATPEQWQTIKDLLVDAVEHPVYGTLKAVDDKMQELLANDRT